MITHQGTLHFNTVTLIDSQVNRNEDSNRRKKVKNNSRLIVLRKEYLTAILHHFNNLLCISWPRNTVFR